MSPSRSNVWGALGAVALLAGWASAQATINVPADQPTIQAGINAAANGDTVLVAPGTYLEKINFMGKAITVRGSGGPKVTTIQANIPGTVVVFGSGEGPASVLEGFTITGGTASGISCFATAPTVRKCRITGNSASVSGGGFLWSAFGFAAPAVGPLLEDCEIVGNAAAGFAMTIAGGGGLHFNGALFGAPATPTPVTLVRCTIEGNSSSMPSGGALFYSVQPTLIDCVVRQNTSLIGLPGLSFSQCTATVANGAIAQHGGGGAALAFSSSIPTDALTLTNCTLFGNSGGGLSVGGSAPVTTIRNSVFWSNGPSSVSILAGTATATTSDIQGGTGQSWFGSGCIDVDPLFAEPAAGDVHLRADSPCKDTGSNATIGSLTGDFEGDPRIASGTVDMGADEFHPHLYVTGDRTPGGTVQIKLLGTPAAAGLLAVGSGVLDPPMATPFGDLHLQSPLAFVFLGFVPANGVLAVPVTIPPTVAVPAVVPMQALHGVQLTNLFVACIE